MMTDMKLHYVVAHSNPSSPERDWYMGVLRRRIIRKIREQAGSIEGVCSACLPVIVGEAPGGYVIHTHNATICTHGPWKWNPRPWSDALRDLAQRAGA
jgi:hypothetical protein